MKACSKCDLPKDNKNRSWCKSCVKQYSKEYRIAHLVHIKQTVKEKFKKSPWKKTLSSVKYRAKTKNIPFDLTEDYLKSIFNSNLCPILGITIDIGSSNIWNKPSLDRINPNLGYIQGNVRFISNRANVLRNNATIRELELILADAYSLSTTQRPAEELNQHLREGKPSQYSDEAQSNAIDLPHP